MPFAGDLNTFNNATGGNNTTSSGVWTSGGVWGTSTSPSGTYTYTTPKGWAQIKCKKCEKELGYIKDSLWGGSEDYYCTDCRLLEKLKE